MDRPDALNNPQSIASEFAALNEHLRIVGDPAAALQRLVELAVRIVPGCEWAAVTAWPVGRPPRSLAASGDVASDADRLQHALEEGPCLAATAEGETVRAADIAVDDRWPTFSAAALDNTPVRGALSVQLVAAPHRTVLSLYSGRPDVFDDEAVTVAALFAAHARVLLMHTASADENVNLEQALATSRQIGAAVGILMATYKITDEEAFGRLRQSSQHLNRKLRDIAADVTETGALPNPT